MIGGTRGAMYSRSTGDVVMPEIPLIQGSVPMQRCGTATWLHSRSRRCRDSVLLREVKKPLTVRWQLLLTQTAKFVLLRVLARQDLG